MSALGKAFGIARSFDVHYCLREAPLYHHELATDEDSDTLE
jgi:hypothetical protein